MPQSSSLALAKPISFLHVLCISAFVIWALLRLVLLVHVGVSQLSLPQVFHTFLIGAWFDLATLAFMVSPVLLLALLPYAWKKSRIAALLQWVLLWAVLYGLVFVAIAEFIFWQEFTTRFNFIAVDYLIYTNEVIGNIRESYPVPLILSLLAVLVSLLVYPLYKRFAWQHQVYSGKQRLALVVLAMVLPALSLQLSHKEQMEISANQYANELAGNGIFTFFAAARSNELDYDKFYKTIPQAQADTILRDLGLQRQALSGLVKTNYVALPATPMPSLIRRPKNIVLISVESLSADYLGAYGNKEGLTPYMDNLIAHGLKFEHLYATGTRTVRGLDALSLGTPPVPGQAIVHRPNNEHLSTIGELLKAQGFNTFFIYGGYGVFDNMNAYFAGNDYQIIDRTDFDDKSIASENVWGVADESLFDNALLALDKAHGTNKPFFAHIMTTSNHRPYTYPDGRIDLPQGNKAGAVKYTDYAIGKFIADAQNKAWFKDTLFVVLADHCASSAGKTKLPVDKYHIAAFMYNPALIAPSVYQPVVSQIDMVPTLLDLLKVQGSQRFFGSSLFEKPAQAAHAFISNYQELGYYKNDTLIVLSPKQKAQAYAVDPQTLVATPRAMDNILLNEAIAYYQTAARSFKQGALKLDAAN